MRRRRRSAPQDVRTHPYRSRHAQSKPRARGDGARCGVRAERRVPAAAAAPCIAVDALGPADGTPPGIAKLDSATAMLLALSRFLRGKDFGMIGGKYAAPIVVPPTVAILGVGRGHEQVLPVDGVPAVRRVLPLSLTFDHRVVTGGEAARFLAAVIADLALPS